MSHPPQLKKVLSHKDQKRLTTPQSRDIGPESHVWSAGLVGTSVSISTADVSPPAPGAVNTKSLCLQCWAWEADSAAWRAHAAAPLRGHLQPPDLSWTVGSSHQEGRSGSPLPVAQGRVGSGQDAPPGRGRLTPAQAAGPHYWVMGPAVPHQ